jgi:predicted ATPase
MMGRPRRIVLTGGPGAGKTAALEIVKRTYCAHVLVAPESASMLFGGGFPRERSDFGRCAAQRAIFHVQVELETLLDAEPEARAILCDRGTLDSLAYWPMTAADFFAQVGTTHDAQLARYDVVIHLEPPTVGHGYRRNGIRVESAAEAASIDARIVAAWAAHPRRFSVPSTTHFLDKAARVIEIIETELPFECRTRHAVTPGGVMLDRNLPSGS